MADITDEKNTEKVTSKKDETPVEGNSKKKSWYVLLAAIIIVASVFLATKYKYLFIKEEARLSVASTSFPGVTRYSTPDNIHIVFKNSANRNNKHYHEQLNAPVAPLDLVGKEVTKGVSLSPALAGKWKWDNETSLIFIPKQDWPADQDFIISVNKTLFDEKSLDFKA